MARESHAILGSGTASLVTSIRKGVVLEDGSQAEGWRVGTNVVVINPEDLYSSPVIGMSGITLAANGTPYRIPSYFNQYGATEFHRRSLEIFNIGPAPYLLVYNNPNLINQYGWPIKPGYSQKFKVLDNVDIYVKASGAETDIRWLEE